MTEFTTVGEIVRELAGRGEIVRPRDITDLFYAGLLPGERCPVLAGRRLIPRDLIPLVEARLRERKKPRSAGAP
jgi:hypothetical protein